MKGRETYSTTVPVRQAWLCRIPGLSQCRIIVSLSSYLILRIVWKQHRQRSYWRIWRLWRAIYWSFWLWFTETATKQGETSAPGDKDHPSPAAWYVPSNEGSLMSFTTKHNANFYHIYSCSRQNPLTRSFTRSLISLHVHLLTDQPIHPLTN